MNQDQLLKILAGAGKILQESTDNVKNSVAGLIEANIMHGKYVQREEYDALYKLTLGLKKRLDELEEQISGGSKK
jgi:BMFP domain-containing protein YqiC